MIENKKRLILKMSILAVGGLILYYVVTFIGHITFNIYFQGWRALPSAVIRFLFSIVPILKLLPVIALAAGIWKYLGKVKTPTLIIILALLVFLVTQPIVRFNIHFIDDKQPGLGEVKAFPSSVLPDEKEAQLSFKIVKAQDEPAEQLEKRTIFKEDESIYIDPEPLLTNTDIRDVSAVYISSGEGFYVEIKFNERGREKFEKITEDLVGQHLAIMIDDEVFSAPVVQEPIRDGRCVIRGPFTREEASRIAEGLTPE